jgi:hypothetical protein
MKNKKGQKLPITSLDLLEIIKMIMIIIIGYIIIKALLKVA